ASPPTPVGGDVFSTVRPGRRYADGSLKSGRHYHNATTTILTCCNASHADLGSGMGEATSRELRRAVVCGTDKIYHPVALRLACPTRRTVFTSAHGLLRGI